MFVIAKGVLCMVEIRTFLANSVCSITVNFWECLVGMQPTGAGTDER